MGEEISKLENIPDDDVEAAKALCHIFHDKATNKQIETAAYPFEFRRREIERLEHYTNLEAQKLEIIRAYHEGYTKLLLDIEKQSADYPFIKSAVAEIFSRYLGLYMLSAKTFYEHFIEAHPLVILSILANNDMRPLIAVDLLQVEQELTIEWPNSTLPHIQSPLIYQ